jgi:hypothetical protein
MADAALAWRRLWRALGLAVDRLLPMMCGQPALTQEDAKERVLAVVTVPGDVQQRLSAAEKATVFDAANFFAGFIAESLPVQVLSTDMKPLLPKAASALAVSRVVNGEREYLGSYDFLLRVHALKPGSVWAPYHLSDMVLDVKVLSVARPLGVNSPTMLTILAHGHAVMTAASKQAGSRIHACRLVAYLLRRPPGKTFHGATHDGSWALLVFDKRVFLAWKPATSKKAPTRLMTQGRLIMDGDRDEVDLTLPQIPVLKRPVRNRWQELALANPNGRVTLADFIANFQMQGRRTLKSACGAVSKKVRDRGYKLTDEVDGVGRPWKAARINDLKRVYNFDHL